ncbi:hypothetical protein OOZ15_14355 [Galbibacter sp. EGI 63066]|uniref:hypothetical protein n=1 Tax=Galbibacter sp. EGI 63066 TaxID=2993559 RepID=UPI00224997EC|nr:hypothetical protein [Galbibacter sp. EGI 63066]MCX2681130.1 hypothetical protein [Galbibacter sp. EGI 63066]
MKLLSLFALVLIFQHNAFGQDSLKTQKWFIGYETLEMSMNRFQNFAGEVGYRINPKHQIRMMAGEVKLTEQHLSSKWQAYAVDGKNVDGYFRIYELYYDRFFFKRKNWYASGSMAYVRDKYNHLISDRRIDNETATIGFAIGYKKINLFGVKHLYINASIPFRYYFNSIPETQWGDTKIEQHKYVNNIWFYIGYQF